MIPRFFTEYLIHDDSDFTIKYGTVNRCNPELIYVSYKVYLNLIDDEKGYDDEIDNIFLKFKSKVKQIIQESQFEDKFILAYDFANDIFDEFKNKILTFDLFIKQKDDNIIQPKLLNNDILNLTSILKIPLQKSLYEHNICFSKTKHK